MIKDNITLQETVDFLNSLLEIDREAIDKLYAHRVGVNEQLIKHPTVQVRKEGPGPLHTMSFLGVINGMFGVDDKNYGPIAIETIDRDNVQITRFVLLKEPNVKS